jgi:hypothetical protein
VNFRTPRELYLILNRIALRQMGKAQQDYLEAYAKATGLADNPAILAAIEAQDVPRIVELLKLETQIPAQYQVKLERTLRTAYVQAAMVGAEYLPPGVSLSFQILNPPAIRWARAYSAQLVVGIKKSNREVIRRILARGLRGRTAVESGKRIAQVLRRDLKQTMGLTVRQYQAVQRFRDDLRVRSEIVKRLNTGATEEAIARELNVSRQLVGRLRNRPWLRLEEKQVEARIERYAARLLKLRAETIAHETITAANAGNTEVWRQAEARGAFRFNRELPTLFRLPNGKRIAHPQAHPNCRCSTIVVVRGAVARREWVVARDDRTCPICKAIPALNPEGVGIPAENLTNLPVPIAA